MRRPYVFFFLLLFSLLFWFCRLHNVHSLCTKRDETRNYCVFWIYFVLLFLVILRLYQLHYWAHVMNSFDFIQLTHNDWIDKANRDISHVFDVGYTKKCWNCVVVCHCSLALMCHIGRVHKRQTAIFFFVVNSVVLCESAQTRTKNKPKLFSLI